MIHAIIFALASFSILASGYCTGVKIRRTRRRAVEPAPTLYSIVHSPEEPHKCAWPFMQDSRFGTIIQCDVCGDMAVLRPSFNHLGANLSAPRWEIVEDGYEPQTEEDWWGLPVRQGLRGADRFAPRSYRA